MIPSLVVLAPFLLTHAAKPPDESAPRRAQEVDQVFVDTWARMWEVDSIAFVRVAETNNQDLYSGAVVHAGAFEDSTDTGVATIAIEVDRVAAEILEMPFPGEGDSTWEEALERLGENQLRFRLVDGTLWQGLAGAEDPGWVGFEVAQVPFDVRGAFDGRRLLDAAFASTSVDVLSRMTLADGSSEWIVDVDADLVGPLGAGQSSNQRLLEAGFDGETGLDTTVTVTIAQSGFVTTVSADLSRWWSRAVTEAHPAAESLADGLAVRLDIRFIQSEKPLNVVKPCDNPEPRQENGIEGLYCPPAGT